MTAYSRTLKREGEEALASFALDPRQEQQPLRFLMDVEVGTTRLGCA